MKRAKIYAAKKTAEGHQTRDHPLPETASRPRGLLPPPPLRHRSAGRPIPDLAAGRFLHHQAARRSAGAVNSLVEPSSDRPGLTAPSTGTASPVEEPARKPLTHRGSIQGSEYTAHRFRAACERMGIRQSMGRAGSALDNAGIESWHSTLEFELRSVQRFATRADAPGAVAAWIDDYNRHRRHSALQMSSPVDFELGPQAPGAGSRPDMVPPSSPWSRPNPPGGLRVAFGQT
jgi:hypothetical protein